MSTPISRTTSPAAHVDVGRVLRAGLLVAISAALANVVVFALERNLLGVSFVFPYQGAGSPALPLPVSFVILASTIPAIAAAVLLAILGKLTRRPLRIFTIMGVIFLIVSFGGPLSVPAGPSTKLALGVMHVVAAVIIIGGLAVLTQPRRPRQA